MKVEKVHAAIKFSQDTGHGAWKSIEIGAEATVDERERWAASLAHLYSDLSRELKTLWAANGNKAQESPHDGAESHVEPPQPVERQWSAGAISPPLPAARRTLPGIHPGE